MLPESALSQPSWRFLVQVSGDPLNPGETGTISASIFNIDCASRNPSVTFNYRVHAFLRNLNETQVEDLEDRLTYLRELDLIRGHSLLLNSTMMSGSIVVSNYTLVVSSVCVGRQVHVKASRLWFPWPGYGRSLYAERVVERTLLPFDVASYIATGSTSAFRLDLGFEFSVPKDLPSELIGVHSPAIEIDAVIAGFTYTFGRPFGLPEVFVRGEVEVAPFRTFRLRLLDNEGRIPLAGAEVRLQAYVYVSYNVRVTSDGEGYVSFNRLPDRGVYSLSVLYRTPYTLEPIPVAVFDTTALELARTESLKTDLYTLRLTANDLKGRPVREGVAELIPVEVIYAASTLSTESNVSNGRAEFPLVPTGNYTLVLSVADFEVGRLTRYIGYHPTYGQLPPEVTMNVRLDDVTVQVVDGMSRPLEAQVRLIDPLGRQAAAGRTRNGTITFVQLPVVQYSARTSVTDSLGEERVLDLRVTPGESIRASYPLYRISIVVLTHEGETLSESLLRLRGRELPVQSGQVTLELFPSGNHSVIVEYRGVVVYESALYVRSDENFQLRARVYDLELRFFDVTPRPLNVSWRVNYLGRDHEGIGNSIRLRAVPDVELRLDVTYSIWNITTPLISQTFRVREAWPVRNFTLPVGELRLSVLWDDGSGFEGSIALNFAGSIQRLPVRAGSLTSTPSLPFGNYGYIVVDDHGLTVLNGQLSHRGVSQELRIPVTSLSIRVTDQFGSPLQGARVSISKEGKSYGASVTNALGVVDFPRLPRTLLPYEVQINVDDYSVFLLAQGDLSVPVPFLNLLGVAVPMNAALIVFGSIATIIVAAALVVYLQRRRFSR